MNKELELDNLIMNYFGRDYDLIDGSDEIRPKIDAYLRQSGKGMQARLLEDIRFFLSLGSQLDHAFRTRYGEYFLPELWGTTPEDFLRQVQNAVIR
ncbi:contact-dependent growth inhibition system immunity protein [Mangrovibacter yixingensis]|uniref:contact-dependent growth inhibition system immunity protein n=1 Tax=Mangrovibacter yixingensis TaxID=1529639 RepID=UPI001CFC5051|nr:contact-dependent growth inhibition system immunity protein [Mangrovibacter yixingensis]